MLWPMGARVFLATGSTDHCKTSLHAAYGTLRRQDTRIVTSELTQRPSPPPHSGGFRRTCAAAARAVGSRRGGTPPDA
jgi:hypothetical protein